MTSREPGRSFVDRMKALEGRDGILSISIAHGFQAADVYDVGTKVLVIGDGDEFNAKVLAEQLGREIRLLGCWRRHPAPLQARRGHCGGTGHSRWANGACRSLGQSGGGVAGDSTVMVEALFRHPDIPAAIGASWDPVAVILLSCGGTGRTISRRFGGKAAATSDRLSMRRSACAPSRPISWCRSSRAGCPSDPRPLSPSAISTWFCPPPRSNIQPACLHGPRHRSDPEKDRRGEIVRSFSCGLRAGRKEHILSRHRGALSL